MDSINATEGKEAPICHVATELGFGAAAALREAAQRRREASRILLIISCSDDARTGDVQRCMAPLPPSSAELAHI